MMHKDHLIEVLCSSWKIKNLKKLEKLPRRVILLDTVPYVVYMQAVYAILWVNAIPTEGWWDGDVCFHRILPLHTQCDAREDTGHTHSILFCHEGKDLLSVRGWKYRRDCPMYWCHHCVISISYNYRVMKDFIRSMVSWSPWRSYIVTNCL